MRSSVEDFVEQGAPKFELAPSSTTVSRRILFGQIFAYTLHGLKFWHITTVVVVVILNSSSNSGLDDSI